MTNDNNPTLYMPLAQALDASGQPAAMRRDTAPEDCDHAGQTWSQDLAMRCTRCGIHLFLPPRVLAHVPGPTANHMYQLWRAAGWPEFWDGAWVGTVPRVAIPAFDHIGGIPVTPERRAGFDALAATFELEAEAKVENDSASASASEGAPPV